MAEDGPGAEQVPETVATYLRLRGLKPTSRSWRKRRRSGDEDGSAPFTPGRDPQGLGAALTELTRGAGWDSVLAKEEVVLNWADIAGADVAKHSDPVSLERGLLTVKCDSTAWTKELHNMRAVIITEIHRRYPDAGVENLRFIGPDVPSWKWGPRAVPGRGPRDTYG